MERTLLCLGLSVRNSAWQFQLDFPLISAGCCENSIDVATFACSLNQSIPVIFARCCKHDLMMFPACCFCLCDACHLFFCLLCVNKLTHSDWRMATLDHFPSRTSVHIVFYLGRVQPHMPSRSGPLYLTCALKIHNFVFFRHLVV